MAELHMIEMLSTGGDAGTIVLLYLFYKQNGLISQLKERIIVLETELEAYMKKGG